jgi:hypothetical protein
MPARNLTEQTMPSPRKSSEPAVAAMEQDLNALEQEMKKWLKLTSPAEAPFEHTVAQNLLGSIKVVKSYDAAKFESDPAYRAKARVAVSWLDSMGDDRFEIPTVLRNTKMLMLYDSKTNGNVLKGLRTLSGQVKAAENAAEANKTIAPERYDELVLDAARQIQSGNRKSR